MAQIKTPSGTKRDVVLRMEGPRLSVYKAINIDDKDETQPSDELFKAYAQQLMIAEREKQKNRKRLN